jgi:hypothetical protein
MTSQATGSEDIQTGRTFNRSMGLLAASAIAVAIGLVTVGEGGNEQRRNLSQTDANEQRPVGVALPGVDVPFTAPSRVLDPTLSRPDAGSDQHG